MGETRYQRNSNNLFQPIKVETIAEQVMEQAEKEFLDFITVQCQKMEHRLMFDGRQAPTLYELDKAIMEHEHVMLALTALYEQARWDLSKAKKKFEEWYALKFIEIRKEVNDPKLSASKWFTKDEINYMVRTKYTKEFAVLETEIEICESKRSLIQKLIEQWNSYAFQLNQLSKNGMAEMNSSNKAGYSEEQNMATDSTAIQLAQQVLN